MEERIPSFASPAPQLSPPVKKSQDLQDEKSNFVNEYACRVLELLGMGHRLFVPRLLAVRDLLHRRGEAGSACFSFCMTLLYVTSVVCAKTVTQPCQVSVLSNCCTVAII